MGIVVPLTIPNESSTNFALRFLNQICCTMETSNQSNPCTTIRARFELGGQSQHKKCGIRCPACRKEMEFCENGNHEFAGCPKCKGMLFEQPVFAQATQHLRNHVSLARLVPAPMDPTQLRVNRLCSTCGGSLETNAFCGAGNAVIDTCIPCGVIFLDAGELTKLVRAPGK